MLYAIFVVIVAKVDIGSGELMNEAVVLVDELVIGSLIIILGSDDKVALVVSLLLVAVLRVLFPLCVLAVHSVHFV